LEGVTASEETVAEFAEVLNDAVVDNGEATGAVEMGMGVRLGDATVGGPSRVTETDVGEREIDASVGNFAGSFFDADVTVDADGNAPGVVAAVLKRFQGRQNGAAEFHLFADIAKDSAHVACHPSPGERALSESRRPEKDAPFQFNV
jgi:hypothetical protein